MYHHLSHLFGVISCPSKKEALSDIHDLREKVDGFELRLDLLPPLLPQEVSSWTDLPLMLTWKEGSIANLLKLLALEPAFVDLPFDAPQTLFETIALKFPKTRIISSYHNFESTPSDLSALYNSLKNPHAHHIKIACHAQSTLDSLRMLHLVKETGCIGLSMGPLGALTRILAPIVGTPWIYVGAPGQIGLDELLATYNFRSLNPDTKIYGLIGNPVVQSPSHNTHNALFTKIDANAVYIKMPLEKKELPAFFSLIKDLPIHGLSVTTPFKESLFPHLTTLSPAAEQIGAVNTLVRTPKGWLGTNTDGKGGLDAIGNVQGKRVVILGAGGAAKALAVEATRRGAILTICNRTISKGERLAKHVGGTFADAIPENYDILINTTPQSPQHILPGSTIMDLPSAPTLTPLLQKALSKGCKTIPGFHMFVYQAIGQFEHWIPEKKEEISRCLQSKLTTSTSTTSSMDMEKTSSSSADLQTTSPAGSTS